MTRSVSQVIEIPANEDGSGVDIHKLKARLQDPAYSHRPKIGSFTAASNVTGTLTDTRAIARLLHEHGAFACFDFAARYADVFHTCNWQASIYPSSTRDMCTSSKQCIPLLVQNLEFLFLSSFLLG